MNSPVPSYLYSLQHRYNSFGSFLTEIASNRNQLLKRINLCKNRKKKFFETWQPTSYCFLSCCLQIKRKQGTLLSKPVNRIKDPDTTPGLLGNSVL
ncbi:uncharacterized protein Gasu_07670 [Galdieria sulphuraria]|uniref:Uncharacterized protein n=1 Tax=Galdieria sulphuraria TaxID=130081 RepID=M2W838_GALSU|nr:uncharacterized protein Gasu_07670 [Galdieria sulphuraria]EME32021.1 hypothetical protein Gasu_07670 [Galdieria sulphuraria]|eukprot:XP_005708541.1 hypothetical protein Gasu_07670 [Galdieria sulphuraria]